MSVMRNAGALLKDSYTAEPFSRHFEASFDAEMSGALPLASACQKRKFVMRWSQTEAPVAPEKPSHAVVAPSAAAKSTLFVNAT